MPDLDEAGGQAMLQEAEDELQRRQRRGLAGAGLEDDRGVVDAEQAAVADGDAVGVAAKDVLGAAEGPLGVDDLALVVKVCPAPTRGAIVAVSRDFFQRDKRRLRDTLC